MIKPADRPKDPQISNTCKELSDLAVIRKKEGRPQVAGTLLDVACALELIRDFGVYGGKIPWYVQNEDARRIVEDNGLGDLLQTKNIRTEYYPPTFEERKKKLWV